jgi:hypothetical protein
MIFPPARQQYDTTRVHPGSFGDKFLSFLPLAPD